MLNGHFLKIERLRSKPKDKIVSKSSLPRSLLLILRCSFIINLFLPESSRGIHRQDITRRRGLLGSDDVVRGPLRLSLLMEVAVILIEYSLLLIDSSCKGSGFHP